MKKLETFKISTRKFQPRVRKPSSPRVRDEKQNIKKENKNSHNKRLLLRLLWFNLRNNTLFSSSSSSSSLSRISFFVVLTKTSCFK